VTRNEETRGLKARAGWRLAVGAAALLAVAGVGQAMPVSREGPVPGVNESGELDIREVLDNATEMDVRLTKQIMLLQRQINDLKGQIKVLEARSQD